MSISWLLVTDMDGTIVPLEETPAQTFAIDALRRAVASDPDLVLIYVTGRHHELALAGIAECGLPRPHALGCDVGTSLYWRDGERWRLDEDYRARVGKTAVSAADIDPLLADVPGIRLQEAERQAEFKRSYYMAPEAVSSASLDELRVRCEAAGLMLSLVGSVDPLTGLGLLDCLPAQVDKASCLDHVRRRLGAARERTIFAGDSGNDVAALLSGCLAVVVGNAPAAVKEAVRAEAKARGRLDGVHFADADCAAGVVEGMRRFGIADST